MGLLMKTIKYGLTSLIAATLLITMTAQADVEQLDSIAAIVDDDVVLNSELNARIATVKGNFERTGRPLPPDHELRTGILNQMIVESIQLQRGYRAGVRISEEQLNNALANIARSQGMDFENFRNQLIAQGSYYSMQDQLRREMIIDQVQKGSLSRQVNITPDELDAFLVSPEGKELSETRYQLSHIVVPLAGSASNAEKRKAKQLISQARELLSSGKNPQAWLEKNQSSLQAGNLGWRTKEQLPSLFADQVESLGVGDVSEVLEAGNGYHIVQMLDTSNKAVLVTQYKSRHILIKPSAILTEEEAEVKANELRERALQGEDFEELARQNSEDIGSAQEGGDLGWSRPGMFVPEFEQTLASLQNGEISKAFQSQFGWHIILLEDTKETDMQDDVMKNRAYSVLRERKFDDVREEWLTQLRDNAYVDIK